TPSLSLIHQGVRSGLVPLDEDLNGEAFLFKEARGQDGGNYQVLVRARYHGPSPDGREHLFQDAKVLRVNGVQPPLFMQGPLPLLETIEDFLGQLGKPDRDVNPPVGKKDFSLTRELGYRTEGVLVLFGFHLSDMSWRPIEYAEYSTRSPLSEAEALK